MNCYLHFVDEEIGLSKVSGLFKLTQLTCGSAGITDQVNLTL